MEQVPCTLNPLLFSLRGGIVRNSRTSRPGQISPSQRVSDAPDELENVQLRPRHHTTSAAGPKLLRAHRTVSAPLICTGFGNWNCVSSSIHECKSNTEREREKCDFLYLATNSARPIHGRSDATARKVTPKALPPPSTDHLLVLTRAIRLGHFPMDHATGLNPRPPTRPALYFSRRNFVWSASER